MIKPTQRPALDRNPTGAINPCKFELSLDAMLEDEIVQLTMASDGVRRQDVLALRQVVPLLARDAA